MKRRLALFAQTLKDAPPPLPFRHYCYHCGVEVTTFSVCKGNNCVASCVALLDNSVFDVLAS